MKKFILSFFFIVFTGTVFSQVFVNGNNINNLNTKYCIINFKVGIPALSVNYGQDKNWKKATITDKNGKSIDTKNFITVLNFMDDNGWKLVGFSKDNLESRGAVYIFKLK